LNNSIARFSVNRQPDKVSDRDRRLEHASFTTGIDDAFEALKKKKALTYSDVLSTHNILFEAMYPWARRDRTQHCGKPWQRPLRPSKVYSERNRLCVKTRQRPESDASGDACRSPAVSDKQRCRMHGGAQGSGAPKENQNARKHGLFTTHAIIERRRIRDLLGETRELLERMK
jgi:hypothetical protein